MQKWFSFSSPLFIGVEIQARGIYLLQIEKKRHQWTLQNGLAARLPMELLSGKVEYSEKLSSYLSVYVDQWGVRGQAAAICLPSYSVRMQSLFLPQGLSETEMRHEVEACAERDLFGSAEEIYMDFCIFPAEQLGYREVYFAIAKKDQMDRYVECVEAAGLKVKVVDIDLYAMKRAIHFCLPTLSRVEGQSIAFFRLQERNVLFAVFQGHKLICHHTWDEEANENIGNQLKEKMNSFLAAFQDVLIHRVVVCASPMIQAMLECTKNWLEWPVSYLQPFERLSYSSLLMSELALQATDFLTVLGLVLRERPAWSC